MVKIFQLLFLLPVLDLSKENEAEPFEELARHFAKLGIASLYYDKRGCGKSEGKYISSTTFDFAIDVEKAIDYLHTIKSIDPNKIGLFGHSEGGLIATMVGAWRTDLAFIILYGSPAIKLDELNRIRKKIQVEAAIKSGMPQEQGKAILQIFDAIDKQVLQRRDLNEEQSLALAEQISMEEGLRLGLSENMAKMFTSGFIKEFKKIASVTWFRAASKINPVLYLELITPTTAILVVNGEADQLVPHELNIPKIQKALAKSGTDVEIVILPNILHDYNSVQQGHRRGVAKELLQVFTSWLERTISTRR